MKRFGLRNHLRAVVSDTALPSLRVIGMAYTGLIGVGAMALVVSVAFLPVAPVLQQATQPARDAVVNLVQPATDVVTSLIVGGGTVPREPFFQFAPATQVALADGFADEDGIPKDAAAGSADDQAVAAEAPPAQSTRLLVASARVAVAPAADVVPPDPVAEDVPVDEPEQAVEARDQAPVQQVAVALADSPVQQAANAEAPRPLPPHPTETTGQTRARLDAENQAAIDAAKASAVRRKAAADAANQTAIDVRKSVTVNLVATPSPTQAAETPKATPAEAPTTTPAGPATPTATPQTRVAANGGNQAVIDTAKAAALRAKADANAANQAAIDAAKAPRSTAKTTSTPTAQPALSTPTPLPSPTAEPTPTTVAVNVLDSASLDIVEVQPGEQDEAPIMLAQDTPED
jgi:hypothetical protein